MAKDRTFACGTMAGVLIEPPPTPWVFPPAARWPRQDFVGYGADLAPGTLLAAYRSGLFPMPEELPDGTVEPGWWSPMWRGILPLDSLRVSRSLRKSCRRFEIRVDTAFREVMIACANPARDGSWISPEFVEAYSALHEMGWAHSVECWLDGELVGGLYGVAIGGLFAGESMFHRETDASKVALVALVDRLRVDGLPRLLDVQWATAHLTTLGVVEIPRATYLARLETALALPHPTLR